MEVVMTPPILLSICIPTYNRVKHLQNCIESIICQDSFQNGDVEIVISDNCSTDNTRAVAEEYCKRHFNIHYFCNEYNIRDKNFPLAISRGAGLYRKLSNDTMIWSPGSIDFVVKTIKINIARKPVILFYTMEKDTPIRTSSLDETLSYVGYYATSISCFGVWADDFSYTEDGCEKFLWQTYFLLKNIVEKGEVLIITKELYTVKNTPNKDLSYGLFNVFYNNFLGIVQYWLTKGYVSQNVYDNIRKDLLLVFFPPYVANYRLLTKNKYKFSKTEHLEKHIEEAYKQDKYYKDFLKKTKKIEIYIRHPKLCMLASKMLMMLKKKG